MHIILSALFSVKQLRAKSKFIKQYIMMSIEIYQYRRVTNDICIFIRTVGRSNL